MSDARTAIRERRISPSRPKTRICSLPTAFDRGAPRARWKLVQHRGEMLRHDAGDGGRAAGDGGRHQQRGRLDAVGNQAMRGAAELIDALDADRRRSQSFDLRAQGNEEIAQIDDFRLDWPRRE